MWETPFVGWVAVHHHAWGLNSSKWVQLFSGCKTTNLGTSAWKNILKMWLIPHYADPYKPPGLLSNDRRLGSSHFRKSQVLICGGLKQYVFHHFPKKSFHLANNTTAGERPQLPCQLWA